MISPADKATARHAFDRASALERDLLARYPDAWTQLDHLRTGSGAQWPDWCLLPMAACVAVTTHGTPMHMVGRMPAGPNAAMSALYAWRFSRSVYLFHPDLARHLLGKVPDDLTGVDTFAGLPQWCTYIAGADPEWPGAGLWAHLEHDMNTGRPELRLIVDTGQGGLDQLMVIPVYLDRPTLTEALADYLATAKATRLADGTLRPGTDVHGGELDARIASLADRVDGLVALIAYLARAEADIANADRPGVAPQRYRSPARERSVWVVGYHGRGAFETGA